jgi:hypothetical protein
MADVMQRNGLGHTAPTFRWLVYRSGGRLTMSKFTVRPCPPARGTLPGVADLDRRSMRQVGAALAEWDHRARSSRYLHVERFRIEDLSIAARTR